MNNQQPYKKCVVCNMKFEHNDDIVCCPVCGAPHHRDCYESIGHCALEENHGTENEYKKEESITETPQTEQVAAEQNGEQRADKGVCQRCGKPKVQDAKVCPHCGLPYGIQFEINIDLLGGIDKNAKLEESISAEDIRDFTSVNSMRYVPKFFNLTDNKKSSWNWAAFLFPEAWFLYRKMYKPGAMFLSLILAAKLCTMPLLAALNNLVFNEYADISAYLINNMQSIGNGPILLCALGGFINIAVRIIAGLFGDYIYKNHAIKKIREFFGAGQSGELTLRQVGGTNFLLFLLGMAIATFVPEFLFSLI